MQPIAEALASITLGAPAQFKNMTLIPLFAAADRAPGYLLLNDALERKLARVSEVSEAGRVPELMFVNDAAEKILLVDGEELTGARQNRILNVSMLVGAHRELKIPVSCVEAGRWHYKSRHFESAGRTLFARARANKMRKVSASLRDYGSRHSDQGEIWNDISAKAKFMRCDSPTESMSDIFEQQQSQIEDYVTAFITQMDTPSPLVGEGRDGGKSPPVAGEGGGERAPGFSPSPLVGEGRGEGGSQQHQVGALFAINGLDLFDAPATFRKFMAKLLRSYAMDAIESPQPDARPPVEAVVRKFLDDMQAAALERFPALGEGEDLRIGSDEVAGGALFADNRVVHLCAFQVGNATAR